MKLTGKEVAGEVEGGKGPNWQLLLIYVVIAVFGLDVLGESVYDISSKSAVGEQEFNLCLAQFVNQKCDVAALSTKCSDIIGCMKGVSDQEKPMLSILNDWSDIFVEEVKENIPLPSIVVAILAAFKFFRSHDQPATP